MPRSLEITDPRLIAEQLLIWLEHKEQELDDSPHVQRQQEAIDHAEERYKASYKKA